MYAALLTKREAATIALEADRGQIGEQPRFIEAARVPVRPITPDRVQINAAGVFGGLAIGLILVARKSPASAS